MINQALYAKVSDRDFFYPKVDIDYAFTTLYYFDSNDLTKLNLENCELLSITDNYSRDGFCTIPYPIGQRGVVNLNNALRQLTYKKLSVSQVGIQIFWESIPLLESQSFNSIAQQIKWSLGTIIIKEEQKQMQKYNKFSFLCK